jgi:ubiquinone/menaquinone biosynthesis C-methylase UbiE
MTTQDSDKSWEKLGQKNPYYWVTTMDEYVDKKWDQETQAKFFNDSANYLNKILRIINGHIDSNFTPTNALDFGCGVGRVTIPLSKVCKSVVGTDVSSSMLEAADKLCKEEDIGNIKLVKGDDNLSKVTGTFDFIHSIYVFQHIPFKRGKIILDRLLSSLEPNGVGTLQFLIHNELSISKKLIYWTKVNIPLACNIFNIIKGKSWNTPMMQLNNYNLNYILQTLKKNGCEHSYIRYTKEDEYYGALIFFQKNEETEKNNFIELGDIP